jgi:N-methylhydantoinase B
VAEIDPITYEVLRHRLASIAREGAIALQRVSGSPLATEAFDLNTSILSAAGEVAFVGPYLLTGPVGQGLIVRAILARCSDEDAIGPGDMFLCNDPYSGSAHQNCVTLVAPIHAGRRLVAWAGATLHVVDVGGSAAGQVGIGARSILDEAPTIPPRRIVAGGRILPEVESEYLERSRTPELNALDLRAKMAALNTIRRRFLELVAVHRIDVVETVIATTIERGVAHLRRRIAELPEGDVVQSAFLDHAGEDGTTFYEVRLRVARDGDRLVFDFAGSSAQAPAVVNCTRSGLASGVVVAVLTTLVWDAPWCPAAIERSIEIRSEPGTVVDAVWPAGCSMATMAAGFAATSASALGLGRLLADSRLHERRAMASWAGAVGSVDVFGSDAAGHPFGTVLLDSMASGTGARAAADGIDSGGFLRSISCVVANVELYEARFPLLYLWRRHERDTGGPGRQRGGVGVSFAVLPHGVGGLPTVIPHFSGTAQPESLGLLGGYPGATNEVVVVRGSTAAAALAAGRVPRDRETLGGTVSTLPGVARVSLAHDDALVVVAAGGGGWGDPLEREPAAVAADVRAGLVSPAMAADLCGVVVDLRAGAPDSGETAARRSAIRRRRAVEAGLADPDLADPDGESSDARVVDGSNPPDGLRPVPGGGRAVRGCPRCGRTAPVDPATGAVSLPSASRPLAAAGPHVAPGQSPTRFRLVERYCPGCLRLVDVDRVWVGEESDTEPSPGPRHGGSP